MTAKADHDAEAELADMRREARRKKVAKALAQEPRAMVDADDLAVDTPESPVLKRYLLDDATVESLGEVCKGNPQGVGIYRDELVSLLRGLDKEGQEQARGFYLSGWNGNDDAQVDRIIRGHHRIESVCLSIIGSTQPGRIGDYLAGAVKDTASNDGLVQRFGLLVWPDLSQRRENIDRPPDATHKRRAFTLFERLAVADPIASWGAEPVIGHDGEIDAGAPPELRLDDEALDLFTEWRTRLEHELRSGELHPAMESHLSKYRKLVPGLALLIHLADDGHGPVRATAMIKALAWSVYLRSHAVRAYGSVTSAGATGAKALLKRIQRGDAQNLFSARDIYRRHWSRLSTKQEVDSAIDTLTDYGWLEPARIETDGRSKTVYSIHPEALR